MDGANERTAFRDARVFNRRWHGWRVHACFDCLRGVPAVAGPLPCVDLFRLFTVCRRRVSFTRALGGVRDDLRARPAVAAFTAPGCRPCRGGRFFAVPREDLRRCRLLCGAKRVKYEDVC